MNPPSALYGAMNKERKPFTYTPGGIDLSEIKSERMAQRLMRNAMSEGVSETTAPMAQSPLVQLNTSAIPNFNCLPVQVFPTFPLPANPKSLLRTRSNPDQPKEIVSKTIPTSTLFLPDDKTRADEWNNINNQSQFTPNSNRHSYDKSLSLINDHTKNKPLWDLPIYQPNKYGSNDNTEVILPEKSYDAEFFVLEPEGNMKLIDDKINKIDDNISSSTRLISNTDTYSKSDNDIERNSLLLTSSSWQNSTANDYEQKEVKIVKKQTKKENSADQNDTEAAVVVKLPAKKSSAKTETKVEVLKKTLPDGSIEEVTKTITKTTIDGKTEIKTETETRILPGEQVEDEEIEEIEEETEDIEEQENKYNEESVTEEATVIIQSKVKESSQSGNEKEDDEGEIIENGQSDDEKSDISTTKQDIVIRSTAQESEEEAEEVEEEEKKDYDVDIEQVIVLKKQDGETEICDDVVSDKIDATEGETQEEQEEEEEDEKLEEENGEDKQATVNEDSSPVKADEEVEENEAYEEDEMEEDDNEEQDENQTKPSEKELIPNSYEDKKEEIVVENQVIEDIQITQDIPDKKSDSEELLQKEKKEEVSLLKTNDSKEIEAPPQETITETSVPEQDINMQQLKKEQESMHKRVLSSEPKVSFREPSIPLDKVEDVEIRPIGPAQEIIKKCHTEIITTTKDEPTGALSTQTEYNRIENIVTVNRTTKTLDNAYEQAEHTIPTVKPYLYNDRILSTPQPISRPYQPVYTPEPQTERRHSLLLDRLSVERQIPVQHTDIYQNKFQNNTQSYEQNQWQSQSEPQSEVLTVSNVKPSTITKNQQWYQQSSREENVTSNILTPTPIMPSQLSQPQIQTQPPYQSYVQPQYKPKSDVTSNYMDNIKQTSFKTGTTNLQPNTYPNSYTPKPTWVSSTYESKPSPSIQSNQYSTLKNETKETYQKSSQQSCSSSYVPPPWEQDSSYIAENQNLYQPPPQTTVYSPNVNQTWKPKPASKFSKPTPTAYIPPAPNQSFVKPVTNVEQNMPGRKTYYSEYERRYISVPESTYIPSETKFQAQPDPSPQYYFDNYEPVESVEPQWRKELREFTEKTSQTTTSQTENISIRPPWEDDPKYAAPQYTSTVTPSWTQTLRPRSWRERSFEPEYIGSKEWPKTNTLGRGRPQSSYAKHNVDTLQERPRGVSVDRYNPSNYQSPLPTELPPVHSHTLNVHPKAYHNPNVPAYHARTSAEPREQTAHYPQRTWGESRAPPVQSRSFKYLQWITGTED